jgi:hypothetical protein
MANLTQEGWCCPTLVDGLRSTCGELSRARLAAAQAGDAVRLVLIAGARHFGTASPLSTTWPHVHAAVRALLEGHLPAATPTGARSALRRKEVRLRAARSGVSTCW